MNALSKCIFICTFYYIFNTFYKYLYFLFYLCIIIIIMIIIIHNILNSTFKTSKHVFVKASILTIETAFPKQSI